MPYTDFKSLIENQRAFFASGATLPLDFRLQQLQKLKSLFATHEQAIISALKKDLNKAPSEAMLNEILFLVKEIDEAIKHLKQWMKPKKISTPFFLWPGRSEIHYDPYGVALIIGPWNYPFMLVMSPLIGAISAGNCVVMKPSEVATHTQTLILELINQHFDPRYIVSVRADATQTDALLKEKFDYIFFTGSTNVGKLILAAAAPHLTPVTLELGGKSPCIVDETANLDFAARRIVWGKLMNAGQTCIAPDYLYVQESCRDVFIYKLQQAITQFYGDNPQKSDDYGRIINQKHFDRLTRLMEKGRILSGGKTDRENLYISPTLIDQISFHDPIMQEEIFGPLLPILSFKTMDEVITSVQQQSKPLALYLFSHSKKHQDKILKQLSFGGGCLNDCIVHIANLHLPFGGVGQSGIGAYHGRYSFETFSHAKSVFSKGLPLDLKLEYPPFTTKKLWWLKQLLRL